MKNLIPTGGMDLDKALTAFRAELQHKRVLYVIQANLDLGEVTKFGIAGMDSGNPFSRLGEYVLMYGKTSKENICTGVKVFFLGTTEYNRLVEAKNSKVFLIEKKLKAHFKSTTEHVGRGLERVSAQPPIVIAEIYKLDKKVKDIATTITRVTRATTQKYRTDRKAYIDTKQLRQSERLKAKQKGPQ